MDWRSRFRSPEAYIVTFGILTVLMAPPAAAQHRFLDRMDHENLAFRESEVGDKIVVYHHQRRIGEAVVEKDYIVYQFDKKTGELVAKKSHWRDGLPEILPAPLISKDEAASRVEGEFQWAELYIISPESDIFRLDPVPGNPCWVVSSLHNGFTALTVVDAVDGQVLGDGVPPPHDAYALTGSWDVVGCEGAWYEWAGNAAAWFEVMGYGTDMAVWPSTAEVQSYVQSPTVSMFYELAHGGSQTFWNGCSEGTRAIDIETWLEDLPPMPFAFIGSCGGMCETGDSTFAYEFRKGLEDLTTTVGYCGMATADCGWCWAYSIEWQDALFRYMSMGFPVKESLDLANADYPVCLEGDCMRFAGDTSFVVVPPVRRGGSKHEVDPYGTGDYPTIQAAVDSASDGDWIELADGTYTGAGNRDVEVDSKGVSFISESGNSDSCIIDCEGLGRGFYVHSSIGHFASFHGMTITNGVATGRLPGNGGGAIYGSGTHMILSNCKILGNSASGDGGGICCDSACVRAMECTVEGNTSGGSGGGFYVSGPCTTFVWKSDITGNIAADCGGGMAASSSAPVQIFECTIAGNSVEDSTGFGGALCCPSLAKIEDCLITGNGSAGVAGGIYFAPQGSLEPRIERCTITGNYAESTGGGIYCEGDSPAYVDHSIVRGNCAGGLGSEVYLGTPDAYVNFSCCCLDSVNMAGDGTAMWLYLNVHVDPGFCDPEPCGNAPTAAGDYQIKDVSPCRRENSPGVCHTMGALGIGCSNDIVTVCADGSGDYPTIQAAVDAASPYDVIELSDGTYAGPGNRDIDLGGKQLTIRSQSGDADACVIDCEGLGRGLNLHSGECVWTSIENLTIANGHVDRGGGIYCEKSSPNITGCILHHCAAEDSGGAIYCTGSSPIFTDCTLAQNSAPVGSAVSCGVSSSVVMEHTIVAFNDSGEVAGCDGSSSIALTCCDLFGNDGGDWIGCVAGQEGVDGNFSLDPAFCDTVLSDYHLGCTSPCRDVVGCGRVGALDVGCYRGWVWRVPGDVPTIQAAIDSAVAGDSVLVSCGTYYEHDIALKEGVVIRSETGSPDCVTIDAAGEGRVMSFWGENSATALVFIEGFTLTGGVADGMVWPQNAGGGIYCESSAPRISHCIFTDNTSEWGGGLTCRTSSARVENCTFADNSASAAGAGIYSYYTTLEVDRSVVAFSPVGQAIDGYNGSATLSCCDLYGNAGGDWVGWVAGKDSTGKNFSADPWFCGPDSGDFTIAELSSCTSGQSPAGCDLVGALGIGCVATDVAEGLTVPPAALWLGPAVPNPFNPITDISYAIPAGAERSRVEMHVYNALGRRVNTLVDGDHGPGLYHVVWDGRDHKGVNVASGVYFYRITWNGKSETKRMILLK